MRSATLVLSVTLFLVACNEDTPQDQVDRQVAYDVCDQAPINGPWLPDGSCELAIGKQVAQVGACCEAYCNGQPLCRSGCIGSDIDQLIEALNYCPGVESATGKAGPP